MVIHMPNSFFPKVRPKIARISKIRGLTAGELQLAGSVFGSALELHQTSIRASGWVLRGYADSPNGRIYVHPDDWCEDYSRHNLAMQSLLVHELVHVWQVQQGMAVLRRALFDRHSGDQRN